MSRATAAEGLRRSGLRALADYLTFDHATARSRDNMRNIAGKKVSGPSVQTTTIHITSDQWKLPHDVRTDADPIHVAPHMRRRGSPQHYVFEIGFRSDAYAANLASKVSVSLSAYVVTFAVS